ncbi:hypothetical protein [Micromonospora sp. NPDC048898]|uniref:hypothetical protein n=1 Tax=Micromonospora sp. NPDC048898 TaxID=3364260 RepID=UPI00372337DB
MRSRETDAYRKYSADAPDRMEQLRARIANAREQDQPLVVAALKDIRKKLRDFDDPDVMTTVCNLIADDLTESFAGMGFDRERLNRFWIGTSVTVPSEAETWWFDDGSALIQIQDDFFGTLTAFAEYIAYPMSRFQGKGLLSLIRKASHLRSGDDVEIAMFAATLRYFMLHRRTWDSVTRIPLRLNVEGKDYREYLAYVALRFAIAHEMAHFVLDHPRLDRTRDDHSLYSDNVSVELAADDLAFQALAWGEPVRTRQMIHLGAVITIWALGCEERAFYVRLARSHPPALTREEQIGRHVPPAIRQAAVGMALSFRVAVEMAADFDHPLDDDWWRISFTHPDTITESQGFEYLKMITDLDAFHSSSPRDLPGFAKQHFESRERAQELFDRLARGDVHGVLIAIGIETKLADEIIDPRRPLKFYRLQKSITSALRLRPETTSTVRQMLGLMLAYQIQPQLRTPNAVS